MRKLPYPGRNWSECGQRVLLVVLRRPYWWPEVETAWRLSASWRAPRLHTKSSADYTTCVYTIYKQFHYLSSSTAATIDWRSPSAIRWVNSILPSRKKSILGRKVANRISSNCTCRTIRNSGRMFEMSRRHGSRHARQFVICRRTATAWRNFRVR